MRRKATPLHTYDMSQFRVLKLVGVSDDYDLLQSAQSEFIRLSGVSISATRSSEYYLDVTHSGANKGAVVLKLSKMLNIPTRQIATIGDMNTDVLMFRKSGLSIAMGNATGDVKAQATYITRSNLEDGFAKNPHMHLFVGMGYYDFACPFYPVEWTIAHLKVSGEIRKNNIATGYYESGHMVYIDRTAAAKYHADLVKFVRDSLPK